MTDADWTQELRLVVRPMLNAYLAERGLPGLLPAQFEVLLAYELPPSDGDPVTWFDDIKEGAVRVAQAHLDKAAQRAEAGAVTVDESAPVEDRRWATLAEILAIEARDNPSVMSWRAHHLPPEGLVSRESAPAVREELDDRARDWLDKVAALLVEWSGWWDQDEAAFFVLTGDPPTARRTRTNIVVRDRASASRVIIEADPRASPQAVADSYRRARSAETLASLELRDEIVRHHRLNGARPHPVTAKNAALALHLARNQIGSWGQRRALWNIIVEPDQPDWVYAADAGFARDASRAWAQVVGETFRHTTTAGRPSHLKQRDAVDRPG